jgi:Methyltransferase domain
MGFPELFDKLPCGLRLRRLFATLWAEMTFPQSCPTGHFYSPIPAREELRRDGKRIFNTAVRSLPEIDLNESQQLVLLQRLAAQAATFTLPQTPTEGRRYYSNNDYFTLADALVLATLLIEHKPQRYLEIGSGFSSALALDVRDRLLRRKLQCVFADPNAGRLRSLIGTSADGGIEILEERIQDVPDRRFQALSSGDVLFVDGSHVAKVGSDVNDVIFRVLPLLHVGVLVHFHDIWWPFEYRAEDVLRGRSWNEAYLLRAFLADNGRYEILLFGSWLQHCHSTEWCAAFPMAEGSVASSLWLRKVRT